MLRSDSPLHTLFGVSTAREKLFAKLGIYNLHQLCEHYPRGYENRGNVSFVNELVPGETQSCVVTVGTQIKSSRIPSKNWKKAMTVQKFSCYDETGTVKCIFFNREYLSYSIPVGTKVRLYGKVSGGFTSPEFISPSFETVYNKELPPFVPKYALTAGLTDAIIFSAVKQAIEVFKDEKFDILSKEQREKYCLCTYYEALEKIHFPKSYQDIEIARKRLAFDELLNFQLGLMRISTRNEKYESFKIENAQYCEFLKSLPFELTGGQKQAVDDIISDMSSGSSPMRRLIQGDVGCGKTVIAAAAVYVCAKNNYQSAMMAPTSILAAQHYNSLEPIMRKHGIVCELLTGSTSAAKKKTILKRLAAGEIDFLIGTHAIIEKNVEFSNLALVVTDEQHRFGVRQRDLLENKVSLDSDFYDNLKPHMLVMSATPIPRTLALMLYGDLEVTSITDLPPGRQKVDTFALGEEYRDRINKFITKHVNNKNQVYVICPLVCDPDEPDEAKSERDALKSVENYCKVLSETFPSFRVGLMHGKLKNAEKEKIMSDFTDGSIDILVSTTVVEVGVNVPNATLMIIENAERFGLSQLHQLRGRVGRGKDKAYCVLFSNILNGVNIKNINTINNVTIKRLAVMCNTNNGFEIAQSDLELRGPGEFFGERQHGELRFKIADISADMKLINDSKELAKKILCENR